MIAERAGLMVTEKGRERLDSDDLAHRGRAVSKMVVNFESESRQWNTDSQESEEDGQHGGCESRQGRGVLRTNGYRRVVRNHTNARLLLDRDIPCWDPLDKGRVG